MSGRGTIYNYGVVYDCPVRLLQQDQPFNVAVIMLDEDPGIQMYSHLPGTPVDAVPVGARVEVIFEATANGQRSPSGGSSTSPSDPPGPQHARRKERIMTPQHPPASLYRTTEGLGLWEHRGKVAAVGVGHSPTARRWDGTPETCVGAWSILALRRAIADAGVSPDQIDGLVLDPVTTTGAYWPKAFPSPWTSSTPFVRPATPWTGLPS